jgi:hypothetical protein
MKRAAAKLKAIYGGELRKSRRQKSTRSAAVAQSANSINYDVAVREGKRILAEMERRWWRLCEIADSLEPRYGERTVERFAEDIGVIPCTFVRRMSVYQAWKSAPGPKCYPPCFAVARELQSHPDRFEIIRKNPDITKRKASEFARQWREQEQALAADDDGDDDVGVGAEQVALPLRASTRRDNNERWVTTLIQFSNEAISDADRLRDEAIRFAGLVDAEVDAELQDTLRILFEPPLLAEVRKAGETMKESAEALIALHDRLAELLAEPPAQAKAV